MRSRRTALSVLALLAGIGSVAWLLPGMPAPGRSAASRESAAPAVLSPLAEPSLYETPFGSIADDIRLMPLEKSLPRAVTSSPAAAPPTS